jgi:hypothetical protein
VTSGKFIHAQSYRHETRAFVKLSRSGFICQVFLDLPAHFRQNHVMRRFLRLTMLGIVAFSQSYQGNLVASAITSDFCAAQKMKKNQYVTKGKFFRPQRPLHETRAVIKLSRSVDLSGFS